MVDRKQVEDALRSGATFTLSYVWDIVSTALSLLRKPLAVLLVIYGLALISAHAFRSLQIIVSPFCFVPGFSRSSLCHDFSARQNDTAQKPQWADYPKLVEVQSRTFEQLLEETAGGSGLSLEIKKAEMATNDLVTLIRVSELRSKDLLATTLVGFVEEARKSARGLQRFTSRVASAVDR